MSYFPMMVELEGANVLVVGGGEEGCKKIKIIKSFGAYVTLIAPDAQKEAVEAADRYICRGFEDADIIEGKYKMVVAATDDRSLNIRIHDCALRYKIPVNVVDDTELCTFIFPAIVKDREVVCAVSSGGRSPYVARHIKKLIETILPVGIGEINDQMGMLREQIKRDHPDSADRRRILKEKLDELLFINR